MNNNDRAHLIKRINTLEGLTDKERSALLGLLRENKTYGLVWEDKPEDVEERLRDELPILTEVPERAIISNDKNAPNHILIEGDNLEALATLAYTHEGKIDVIYIDPPYNTGNKDFIYNDSYVDKEDSYRHSKWLSFMSRRLKIAKKLLSEHGVIFISIDDNEQAQLKLLCDEIFNNNFVGMISRATGTTTGQDTGSLGKACDYILVYSSKNNYVISGIPLTEKDLERYSLSDERGFFSILQLRRTGGEDRREDRPTMFFPIIAPDGSEVFPYGPTGYESRWRVGPKKVEQMKKDNLLYFKKDKNNEWKVYYKFYSENKVKRPSNFWQDIEGNKKAQIELKNILESKKFDTPKPTDLIRKILGLANSSHSIILDFFAGSGTTLHATMQLNVEDGGHRQCILVTNNENNICEEVTYERNKRVIQGYTNSKGEEVAGLTKNNLRYYRTGFVGRNRSMQNMRKLVNLATDMLCIKEDLYTEQNTFGGQKTYKGIFRYFDNGKKQMLVIYREEAIDELVDIIYDLDITQPIKVYVFSPSEDPWEGSFDDVSDKVELCALPQAIYNTYRRILPKKKDAIIAPEDDTLATTQKDKDLFDGMLNFTDEEEA